MSRRSSVRGDVLHVETAMGLGQFKVGAPPWCRPPFYLVVKKSEVTSKSSFKYAENRAASSPVVEGHRNTRISCVSKLIWVLTRTKPSCSDERETISYSLPDFQQI